MRHKAIAFLTVAVLALLTATIHTLTSTPQGCTGQNHAANAAFFATFLPLPYVLFSSIVLAFRRKTWLSGSWKRWWKQTALSWVLTILAVVVGYSVMVFVDNYFDMRSLGNQASTMIFTAPFLVLAAQFTWLKIKTPDT